MNEKNIYSNLNMPKVMYENYIEDRLEQDLVIPDYYCVAQKVVCCEAEAVVTSKGFLDDKVVLEGTCIWNIMYLSEEDGALHHIKCEKPFAEYFAVTCNSGNIRYKIKTKGVACKLQSKQRGECRATLCIALKVTENVGCKLLDGKSDDEVQLLRETVSVYEPLQETEKEFKVLSEIALQNKDEYSIYKVSSVFDIKESRCMEGKAVVKGVCRSNIILLNKERRSVECMQTESMFTQLIEQDGIGENCYAVVHCEKIENDVSFDVESEETILIGTTAKLTANFYRFKDISLCLDCYHPTLEMDVSKEEAEFYTDIKNINLSKRIVQTLHLNTQNIEILSLDADGDIEKIALEERLMIVDGKVNVSVLYTVNGEVIHMTAPIPFQITKTFEGDFDRMKCEAQLLIDKLQFVIVSDTEIEVSCECDLPIKMYWLCDKECITDISVLQNKHNVSPETPLVIYYGKKGERLWDIAKKYCVPVNVLKINNEITTDSLMQDQLVLITKQ